LENLLDPPVSLAHKAELVRIPTREKPAELSAVMKLAKKAALFAAERGQSVAFVR